MKCFVLDPRSGNSPQTYINNLYTMWHDVWSDVYYKENKGSLRKITESDEFSRQHFIVAIFDDFKPVGMVAFRRVNIANQIDRNDSWLKAYFDDDELIPFINKGYEQYLICSNVTTSPDYRKSTSGTPWGLLVMQLAFLHAYHFEYDICFGVTDNKRGVDKIASVTGMEIITREKSIHGVGMSTVYNSPEILKNTIPNFSAEVWNLFENTKYFYQENSLQKERKNDFRKLQTKS